MFARFGSLVAVTAIVLALGCDGGGDSDAGTITLMDSGARDSGPGGGVDAGPGGSCAVTALMGLPAACTPRCSSATLSAVSSCGNADCLFMALEADTTPTTPLMTPNGTEQLDCVNCFVWQRSVCWAMSCPTQFQAFATCDPDTDAMECMPQTDALQACLDTNMTAVGGCADGLIGQCFASGSPFLPEQDLGLRISSELLFSFDPRFALPRLH